MENIKKTIELDVDQLLCLVAILSVGVEFKGIYLNSKDVSVLKKVLFQLVED